MDETLKKRIDEMVQGNKVFLFMKGTPALPNCGFSARVAHVLQKLGVEFGSFNVLTDQAVWQGIKVYSNWPTIPQLFIDGKFVGGCDITEQMAESGELQKLLGIEGKE